MTSHGLITNIRLTMATKLSKTFTKPKSLFKRITQVEQLKKGGLHKESREKIKKIIRDFGT